MCTIFILFVRIGPVRLNLEVVKHSLTAKAAANKQQLASAIQQRGAQQLHDINFYIDSTQDKVRFPIPFVFYLHHIVETPSHVAQRSGFNERNPRRNRSH